jgi:hypothetical protein
MMGHHLLSELRKFYNGFNSIGMSDTKLVVSGSPDTHNLLMPIDAHGD